MTKKLLPSLKKAIDNLEQIDDMAVIPMENINHPDTLVVLADFFLKLAEVSLCIVSGVFQGNLIIIFRNAGFRKDKVKFANATAIFEPGIFISPQTVSRSLTASNLTNVSGTKTLRRTWPFWPWISIFPLTFFVVISINISKRTPKEVFFAIF